MKKSAKNIPFRLTYSSKIRIIILLWINFLALSLKWRFLDRAPMRKTNVKNKTSIRRYYYGRKKSGNNGKTRCPL